MDAEVKREFDVAYGARYDEQRGWQTTPPAFDKRGGKGKGNEPAAGACCQEGQEDLKHFLAHVTVLCCVVVGEN
jgi:hypothetical protein